MKFLRVFEDIASYEASLNDADFMKPNVSLIRKTGEVKYMTELPESSSVYIQHADGSLYTVREWTDKGFVSSNANGVAVIDDKAQFVIARSPANLNRTCRWADDTDALVPNVLTTTDLSVASEDYDGSKNTRTIVEFFMNDIIGNAADKCSGYIPLYGTPYLPSVGEWMIASKYKAEIDEAMRILGTSLDTGENLWASTQGSTNTAWSVFWGTDFSGEGFNCITVDKSMFALPWAFCKLTL